MKIHDESLGKGEVQVGATIWATGGMVGLHGIVRLKDLAKSYTVASRFYSHCVKLKFI
jgi:hypothetical protein